MLKKIFKKNETTSADLELLEAMLHASMTPVVPDSGFVSRLRYQLLWSDLPDQLPTPRLRVPSAVLLIGGVLGSVLVLLTSIRGLISLLGVIGLIRQQMRRSQPQKTAAAS